MIWTMVDLQGFLQLFRKHSPWYTHSQSPDEPEGVCSVEGWRKQGRPSFLQGGWFTVLIRKGSTMEIHLNCFTAVIFFISDIKKVHENEADKWIWMKSMVERITSPHHQMSLPSSLEAENMLPNMAKWSLHMWLSEGPCHGEIILDYPSRPNVITGPSGKGGGRGFSVRRERDGTLLLALKWRKEPDAKSAGGL